jgi:hypothetical protein
VPGIYAALLDRERQRVESAPVVDPRWRFSPRGLAGEPPPEKKHGRAELDRLEAGVPVRREGRSLKFFLPEHRLRREDAFEWFVVRRDDTVRRCDPAEG